MEKEYTPYIGKNFEKSKYRILIIIDEINDFADFKKTKYDNYCHYLIAKNDAVKKILAQYDLKKNDVACYNYRYNCKSEIKLEELKGKELTEYNNELRNRINQLKPCNIIIQREQITRNVTKRKKYFDSGKITFEKFLEIKGIKLFECRKDGKQDSSLIKDRFLELKSSLNKINVFLETLNPCIKTFAKTNKEKKREEESFFIYSKQSKNCKKSVISPKDLNKFYNLSQTNYASEKEFLSDHQYDHKWEELNIKVCEELGIPFPNNEISRQLQGCINYYNIKDCIKSALLIINELVSEDEEIKTSANTKTKKGNYLIIFTDEKQKTLDKIKAEYKEKNKLSENNFYFHSYIDNFDLLYVLKEKNYQNLTERPLSWYNERLFKFIMENKPSAIVFCGGLLTKTIFKNKIPSINKKLNEFLMENNILYFTKDRVTRENPSTKKDRLFQIKSLMENLQDDLNNLNPCNAAGELALKNEKWYGIPENLLKEKTYDELCTKYHVSDSELERYHRYRNADDTLQKVIRKVNEVMADDEELKKVNRMLLLLVGAFVPLPMFFELLDSFKDESDFNRIKKITTDRSSMIMYNVEFWEKYKDKKEYEKKKISSYNKRLNNFFTRLKEGHYDKDLLELMKERIFEENQIKKIKIYRDLSFFCCNADEYEDIKEKEERIKEMIDKNRSALRKVKKDSDAAQQIKEKIDELRSQKDKIKEDIAIQRGDRPKEKDRNYILNHLWKPENP